MGMAIVLADLENAMGGIQQFFLHGEGAEMDRKNPNFVAALDKLYAIISKYDLENVYNMDETGTSPHAGNGLRSVLS